MTSLTSFAVESDKSFWHDYLGFYDTHLPKSIDDLVVEFGVLNGQSISWLLKKYPACKIIGVDILPVQKQWPQNEKIYYKKVDQASEKEVSNFFSKISAPSLIIEDGSHLPSHQSRCLRIGFGHLKPGGIYVLEDIHTSHPSHNIYNHESQPNDLFKRILQGLGILKSASSKKQTALTVLLAFEHIKRTGRLALTSRELNILSHGGHFTKSDILDLYADIKSIHIYKRATLPTSCYRCGKQTFNYHQFKCNCGVNLLEEADSMSIIIKKN